MNVKEQIAVLQKAIDDLSKYDDEMSISGHVSYPDGCYSGDLDGEIYNIRIDRPANEDEMEDMDEEERSMYLGVTLGIFSK